MDGFMICYDQIFLQIKISQISLAFSMKYHMKSNFHCHNPLFSKK
jgi:hypothetical protein